MNKNCLAFIFLFCFFTSIAQQSKQLNSAEIQLELEKLKTVGSVLYIAAHPDDENTGLLAYFANERKVRTAYLSLTRGDGGQNLIGNEQGELLGMIRTQELLEARKSDGAEQYFSSAYDFGFSKNPEETFQFWDKEKVLEDVVYIIRKLKPDVIITRFPTTGEGGHGHHTASAIIASEAFDVAADPTKFPESAKQFGVWQAKRLVWNTFNFGGKNTVDSTQLKMNINNFNPLLGKSYGEIAAESRTMHKSQGMGRAKNRDEIFEYFKHLKGAPAKNDLLEGVNFSRKDTSLTNEINKAISVYASGNSEKATEYLLSALEKSGAKDIILTRKIEKLLLAINGIYLETTANKIHLVKGDSVEFTTTLVKRNNTDVDVELKYYSIKYLDFSNKVNLKLTGKQNVYKDKVLIQKSNDDISAKDFSFSSNPYWLDKSKQIGNFVFDKAFTDYTEYPLCTASYVMHINGKFVIMRQPIYFKTVDPVDGEVYKEAVYVPKVSLNFENDLFIFSDNKTVKAKITVVNYSDSIAGKLVLKIPHGFSVSPAKVELSFGKNNRSKTVEFEITKNGKSLNDSLFVLVEFTDEKNNVYNQTVREINYKHIKNMVRIKTAQAKIISVNVKTLSKNIAYIEGAGDDVKECLQLLNYNVSELTQEKLKTENLSVYDAIIVGIRAYNTHEWLADNYEKLMNYVSNGGNLIVQYNTNNFISNVKSEIGPYPFKISRERVTSENAAMKVSDPQNPILNFPNKINESDFENWVQERGIYFASDLDKKYIPVFLCNDPGEKEQNGSLIVCNYGKGNFVYTGLSFFRQLPAGVPGAYRLFVNCIEYGKKQ